MGKLKDEAAAYLEEKADPADIDDGIANIEAGVGDMDEELVEKKGTRLLNLRNQVPIVHLGTTRVCWIYRG